MLNALTSLLFTHPLQITREVLWSNTPTQITPQKRTFACQWSAHVGLHGAECRYSTDQSVNCSGMF